MRRTLFDLFGTVLDAALKCLDVSLIWVAEGFLESFFFFLVLNEIQRFMMIKSKFHFIKIASLKRMSVKNVLGYEISPVACRFTIRHFKTLNHIYF